MADYELMVAHALHVYIVASGQGSHDEVLEAVSKVVPRYRRFYDDEGTDLLMTAERLFPGIIDSVRKGTY